MNVHKTAITRTKPSAPMKYLESQGLLSGKCMLDYGCGKGFDADHYGMDKFDPHFFPTPAKYTYDVITCNYVLNIVQEGEGQEILHNIKKLLRKGGRAYISVRRDVKQDGITKKGTFQRDVTLDLPVVHQKSGRYCIYAIEG